MADRRGQACWKRWWRPWCRGGLLYVPFTVTTRAESELICTRSCSRATGDLCSLGQLFLSVCNMFMHSSFVTSLHSVIKDETELKSALRQNCCPLPCLTTTRSRKKNRTPSYDRIETIEMLKIMFARHQSSPFSFALCEKSVKQTFFVPFDPYQ